MQSLNGNVIRYNTIPACGKSPTCCGPCVQCVYVTVSNVFHVLALKEPLNLCNKTGKCNFTKYVLSHLLVFLHAFKLLYLFDVCVTVYI